VGVDEKVGSDVQDNFVVRKGLTAGTRGGERGETVSPVSKRGPHG